MHGRVKVKSASEVAERKHKEQLEKAKQLKMASDFALRCRRQLGPGAGDEGSVEAASEEDVARLRFTTEQLLLANPDFSTIWNVRRELLRAQIAAIQGAPAGGKSLRSLVDDELVFVKNALNANIKSYSCWHQRCWLLDHHPEPDYGAELRFIDDMLAADSRNFHCWDYWRVVAERASLTKSARVGFQLQLLARSISNGSAWHNLAALLDDATDGDHPLETAIDLALNAVCTDTDDQSAWMFLFWLLHVKGDRHRLATFRVRRSPADDEPQLAFLQRASALSDLPADRASATTYLSTSTLVTLRGHFRDLLELGNDSRFVLLALLKLESLIADAPDVGQAAQHLVDRLGRVDPAKAAYYRDLASLLAVRRFALRNATWAPDGVCDVIVPDVVALRSLQLTCFAHGQFFARVTCLDLRANCIASLDACAPALSQHLAVLLLGRNVVATLHWIAQLDALKLADLSENRLSDGCLDALPQQLFHRALLYLYGNPLSVVSDRAGCDFVTAVADKPLEFFVHNAQSA